MKSLLAEIEDWDEAFISEPRPCPIGCLSSIEHLKRQIAAQSEMALLLVKACGLEVPDACIQRR